MLYLPQVVRVTSRFEQRLIRFGVLVLVMALVVVIGWTAVTM